MKRILNIMYVGAIIMLYAAPYALGQGVELYDGIISNSPDTVFSAKSKIHIFADSEFLLKTYDKDRNFIYGVSLNSLKRFGEDSIQQRDLLLEQVFGDLKEKNGEPSLNRSDGYMPFLFYNQTFTVYAWKNPPLIILVNLFGRNDNTNIIKIEIYDLNLLE